MSQRKHAREEVIARAKQIHEAEGSDGLLIEMFVLLSNHVTDLAREVNQIKGVTLVLTPLVLAILGLVVMLVLR